LGRFLWAFIFSAAAGIFKTESNTMKPLKQHFSPLSVAKLGLVAIVGLFPTAVLSSSFHNLDFESAVINGEPYSSQPASQALPGWTISSPNGYVLYDSITLDSSCISLHDGLGSIGWGDFFPLQGHYSIMLQDGGSDFGSPPYYLADAYIAQTGDVPSNARSILFSSDTSAYIDHFVVSLNGMAIPMYPYSTGQVVNTNFPAYGAPVVTYIGDVSAFADQTDVELRFTKLVQDPSNEYIHGFMGLDAVHFSSISIPEPSTLTMLAVGAISLGIYLFRRRTIWAA
jgi:hypothetical protein